MFVKGTTEASTWRPTVLAATGCMGDAILITEMDVNHANIVPGRCWRRSAVCSCGFGRCSPTARWIWHGCRTDRRVSKPLALIRGSNAGQSSTRCATSSPAPEPWRRISTVLVDGAQAVMHQRVDVQTLDCDFYVFSGISCMALPARGML